MRSLLLIALLAILKTSVADEGGWSWNGAKQAEEKPSDTYSPEITDLFSSPSEPVEQYHQPNSTDLDQVVDEILTSTRQGRNVDGLDDVYSDPNIQNALQNGDDGEARNLIKERLCSLGLMKVNLQILL